MIKFETVKNKIRDNKKKKIIAVTCVGLGVGVGLAIGYTKWGRITTMIDPYTGAIILTKRRLTSDECCKLAVAVMENGYNVAKGLSDMNMLYGM